MSVDGRCIVFGSTATNLTANDSNGLPDVFIHDRQAGTTELVSVSSAGLQGDGNSGLGFMSISGDGGIVAFDSSSTNLVSPDLNGWVDVFAHDRSTGSTVRVSVSSSGAEGNSGSFSPSLSLDGRYVAFLSYATNLVAGDSNLSDDCFVHDRLMGTTERISVNSSGVESNGDSEYPVISADGRFVAFMSLASNLVAVDTNGTWDVFLHDRLSGNTLLVSVDSAGGQGLGSSTVQGISGDGRYVVFSSAAPNLVSGDTNGLSDAFIHDMLAGSTERISVSSSGGQANAHSSPRSVSDDGRYVTFQSLANNLVGGDTNGATDVFLRDRLLGTTERIDIATNGMQANAGCGGGSLTPDGRYVMFSGNASNLVFGDTNNCNDAFIRDRFAAGFASLCEPGGAGVIACPCNNPPSGAARGCDNSSFTGGATLSASGIAYLSMDSLSFSTSDERPSATSILLQGDAIVPNGAVFGQGVRCVGGSLKRMYAKTAVNGSITAPDLPAGDPTISARSAALGIQIQPGQPYYYLVYYRDPIVLGGCPVTSTFNATQSGSATWWP